MSGTNLHSAISSFITSDQARAWKTFCSHGRSPATIDIFEVRRAQSVIRTYKPERRSFLAPFAASCYKDDHHRPHSSHLIMLDKRKLLGLVLRVVILLALGV